MGFEWRGDGPSDSSGGLIRQLPVSFSFEKILHSLCFYFPQVPDVGIPAQRLQRVELGTGFEFLALPAARDAFLLTAPSH